MIKMLISSIWNKCHRHH